MRSDCPVAIITGGAGGIGVAVAERYGRCDVLVNCAGITRLVAHGDLDGLDDDLIDEILTTNVRGCFATLRALLPLLRASSRRGGAVVVNISSIAAQTAVGSKIMYCASKAAVDNMTRSLAWALAPAVRVVSVSPARTDVALVELLALSNDLRGADALRWARNFRDGIVKLWEWLICGSCGPPIPTSRPAEKRGSSTSAPWRASSA